MVIKNIDMKDLVPLCVQLISKTLVELGQSKDSKHIVVLSQSLAYDLKEDFKNLTFVDIEQAFRQGVRSTDKFVLNVQTYYQWIKTHRQLIWDNTDKEPERQDKRIQYRSRQGTGLKTINNHLKSLKNG
tara:strand:+ start:336 stop:722 length:387 start_codon:yes stop_codon:yes gene_type:complete